MWNCSNSTEKIHSLHDETTKRKYENWHCDIVHEVKVTFVYPVVLPGSRPLSLSTPPKLNVSQVDNSVLYQANSSRYLPFSRGGEASEQSFRPQWVIKLSTEANNIFI